MDARIKTVYDKKRGCGYRNKKGALYMMGGSGNMITCGRLPIPLTTCPTCNHGIKYSRGWTWVDADKFIEADHNICESGNCERCIIFNILEHKIGRAGLLWVGKAFYPTVESFAKEAEAQGISRRISAVPNDFIVGETWVLLAHIKAIPGPLVWGEDQEFTPGIFQMFKPERIEVICDGSESKETIDDYIRRGLMPVKVEIDHRPENIFDVEEKAEVNNEEKG